MLSISKSFSCDLPLASTTLLHSPLLLEGIAQYLRIRWFLSVAGYQVTYFVALVLPKGPIEHPASYVASLYFDSLNLTAGRLLNLQILDLSGLSPVTFFAGLLEMKFCMYVTL